MLALETERLLRERLRFEETRKAGFVRALSSAQSAVRTIVLQVEESDRIIKDIRQILGDK